MHSVRQLYRLAIGSILSSSASLLEEELRIIRRSFRPYGELMEKESGVENVECPICLGVFEGEQMCIRLPGCRHVFHAECIDEWLVEKSNCPYCRSNIRLEMLRV